MSGSSKLDLAAMTTSGVLTADELMKAMEASHEKKDDQAKSHFTHAAIGAAIAIGAFHLLRQDEAASHNGDNHGVVVVGDQKEHHRHHHAQCKDCCGVNANPDHGPDHESEGHESRLAEEIIGAYSLGQEIMGHKQHHVAHLVVEALGAAAAVKEAKNHTEGVL